jgi:hypothetical protein
MSRNLTIAVGTLLWLSFAVVALVHVAVLDDWIGPAVAVVIVTAVVAAYHARRRAVRAS